MTAILTLVVNFKSHEKPLTLPQKLIQSFSVAVSVAYFNTDFIHYPYK